MPSNVGDDCIEMLGARGRRDKRCGELDDLLVFREDFDFAYRVMAAAELLVEQVTGH